MVKTNTEPLRFQISRPEPRRPAIYINNFIRIELLILITECGLSCYAAAQILKIPYTNAKVIYRVFRVENRVMATSNIRKKSANMNGDQILKKATMMRTSAYKKLIEAL